MYVCGAQLESDLFELNRCIIRSGMSGDNESLRSQVIAFQGLLATRDLRDHSGVASLTSGG